MPNNLVLPKGGGGSAVSASSSRGRPGVSLSAGAALGVLTAGKLSRVAAAFASFAYLEGAVALPLYLFFVTSGAAACLLALQRPWRGRRVGARRAKRVALAGAVMAAMLYVWCAGLRSAGPLRALLIDGAELPLLYVFAVVSRRELPERRKTRGAAFMLLSYALLVWDASGHAPDIAGLERTRLAQRAEMTLGKFGKMTADRLQHSGGLLAAPMGGEPLAAGAVPVTRAAKKVGRRRLLAEEDGGGTVRDLFVEGTPLRAEVGVLLVLAASVIMQASRPFSRRLSAELGGPKRHFALSVTACAALLSPLAALSYVSSSSGAVLSMRVIGGVQKVPMNASHVAGFAAVGFMWLVLPYYARAIVSTAMDQRTMLQAGVVVPFALAATASTVFGLAEAAGGVSWILVLAFVLDSLGLSLMVAGGGAKRALSELPIDSRSVASINGSQARGGARGE